MSFLTRATIFYMSEDAPEDEEQGLEPDGNTHMIPEDDIIVHRDNWKCECSPIRALNFDEDGDEIWVHRRMADLLN